MPKSLKVEKKNNKWDLDTANLCGSNATHIHQVIDEKSQSIFVHPPGNVRKDFKSPRRIVASPHRFKTQISKIINTRETQQRSPRGYRRSINGNQISKSLSGGQIGCSECKSCRGINRSTGNSQRTKTFELSQNDSKLQTNLVNKKIIFLDPKSELAVRSSIKKEEIKQRLEQLRKNSNRLIRKSIQRKMIQEGKDKSIKTLKNRGLEKTQQKIDRSLKEANTRQSEIQNIKFFAKNIDSSFNQKQDISPLLKNVKTPAVNNDTKSFKLFAEDVKSTADSRTFPKTLDFQKRKQNTNSIDTLHSNIENDNCLIGCYKSSDTPTRTSPLLQSQYQDMRMICKPGNEELSYCNIGTVSSDNKSQCLKEDCNDEMPSLCLEKLPAHLITVNSSDYNLKYPIDTFENLSCDTNVRKTEMPFWLRPSPIHIYPYNFVLAVRRKLEYIVNPPLSRMESTESIETKQCADKNTMESVVSNALVISGADRKLHSLTDSPHRQNSCVTSKSSKMCIMNEIGTTEANNVSEENSDWFKNDDTTISSSIFDSPKTMDAERNMMLSSISPLPSLNNDQIENNFDSDNNLNQLLDDFNNSLSHAMQVNEQIKNKTRLTCSSREENVDNLLKNSIRLRDYQDSSRSTLSNQLKDKNSCAGVKSINSESPSNQYKLIRTTINEELDSKICTSETAKIKNTSVGNNSDYLTEIEPDSVSPLNLPNLRLTHFNDTYQKRLNKMEYSSSIELDYEQSQYNTRSLITKISQQSRTKNCKKEVSMCDYLNEAKNIVYESLEPSENLVKKASMKTTLNVESIIKTKSNAGNGYMVSKSSKSPLESRHTFKDVVCGNKACDMRVLPKRDTYNLLSPTERNATISKFKRSDLSPRQSSPSTSYPSPPSSSTLSTPKTKTMAIDKFKTLLQTGEKILLDRTKSQIAWLEVLKDHYKENGLVTHIATVKKKQRGLLLKLDQEREKIKRLLYSTRPSLELNMPTENKSSKLLSTESRRKSFSIEGKSTNRTKSIHSTAATTYRGLVVDNPRLMDYMLRQRELDLNKKCVQQDVNVCDQQINGEETEVLKLEQTYLKSCNIPTQRNSPPLLIDGIVRKEKVEDDFKETEESTEDFALQRLKQQQQMKKIEPNRSCNLLKNELGCEYGDSQTVNVTHNCARKCNRKVANDVFQMNELIMQEVENKNETVQSSDQCNDSADECSFSKKQSVNCPCAFEMDFREGATSGTDTESLYSARQEILERNKLIERNITKFVSMTKDIITQHVSLRRSFSDNQVYQESIGERSDYCKTWPNRRKMFYFKRFSTNPAIICSSKKTINKLKNSSPNSEKTSMVDVKQISENCVNTSYVGTPRKLLSTNDEVTATGHYSKYDCKNEQVKESNEMGTHMIESTDTRINSKCEISKTENAPSYYESTVSNTEDNLLSKRCQNDIVSENFSRLHSKTDTEKDQIPSVLTETAKDCLHESKIVTEFQIQSIDKSMSKSDNSLENASKQLPICSELTYDRDADQVLTKANSPLKDNVKNRQRQIKNNIHAETNIREIPNKPPPPYVPPAPGSPMTTIFPSEERIKDITFRRSHELFCHLLKIDYTNSKGDKLPSLMEERITNIYERIILDICQEYLNDHKDVVSQGNPADFHGQLAFFNPPDRLSCIQNAIYKEVQKCLALHKSSPKRHQVFSIYGQRAKRDHIGKIIIQEIYDEDEQWCNFQREENEVLELMVGEMITHQMVKISKEEWLD